MSFCCVYDDPELGLVVLSKPRGCSKQLSVDPNILGELVDLCKSLTFKNKSKLVLLLSFSTSEMIKCTMMTQKSISWIVLAGQTDRKENYLFQLFAALLKNFTCLTSLWFLQVTWSFTKNCVAFQFLSHLLIINMLHFFSSGKAWVFCYIIHMIFPQIFGAIIIQRNQLGLTDEDPSEHSTLEANTEIYDNYRHSKVMLCTFHAIWKPFRENIRPDLVCHNRELCMTEYCDCVWWN